MAACNMMRNPVFQVLRFASPKVVTPLNFLEKCLNMLIYLVSLLRNCCLSSCTVGGFFPIKQSELRKNCLPCYLCVSELYCIMINQTRNRPSKYLNKCCPHSLIGTSPRSISYISPTPPGNNHG